MSQILDTMANYTRQAQGGITTHDDPENQDPAQSTYSLPRGGLGAASSKDELMREKMEMLKKTQTGKTPFGTITATDKDFEWLRKKRETAEFANFDSWVGKNFHKGDLAARKWLQQTFPQYYEDRERLMVDRAKFALRVKLLKLRGPKNQKDLLLLWGLQTGRIKLDEGWDIVGFHEGDRGTSKYSTENSQNRFARNLFSDWRLKSNADRNIISSNETNPFRPNNGSMAQGQYDDGVMFGHNLGANARYFESFNQTLAPL